MYVFCTLLQELTCPRESKRVSSQMKYFALISNEGLRVAGRSFALEQEVVVSKIQEDFRDPYSIVSNPALLAQSENCCYKPEGKNSKIPLLNSITDSPLWHQLLFPGGAPGQLSWCTYLKDRQASTLISPIKKSFLLSPPSLTTQNPKSLYLWNLIWTWQWFFVAALPAVCQLNL